MRFNKDKQSPERIAKLNAIGMVWNTEQYHFNEGFRHAEEYQKQFGDLKVPIKYVCKDGYELGRWISLKRRLYVKGRMSEEYITRLESIGMIWDMTMNEWLEMYAGAKQYFDEHGTSRVPVKYQYAGKNLYIWLNKQKRSRNQLTPQQIKMLDEIGINWQ